ncbi:MAG: hypothetical protein M0Z61_06670 [Nitrospiraceae bacterium]|nr:hypothetical protein [Nitrospiraceae bacterium]
MGNVPGNMRPLAWGSLRLLCKSSALPGPKKGRAEDGKPQDQYF